MRSLSLRSLVHATAVMAAMYTGGACSRQSGARPAGTGGQAGSGGDATGGSVMATSRSGGTSGTSDVTGSGGGSTGVSGSGGAAATNEGGGADGGGTSRSGGVTGASGSTDGGQLAASGGAMVPPGSGGRNTGGATALGGAGGGTGSTVTPRTNFTETVGSVSFDMVYVPGGTFTLGCEAAPCPPDTKPVSGVKVSSYYIGKREVTTALWNAVTGNGWDDAGGSVTRISWPDAIGFSCELSRRTGRNYRMMTEAEFEYAAKNYLSSLEDVGSGEEWAYNSWSITHTGGTDPVGPKPGEPVQKTRRDVQGTVDSITGRLIRARDGLGPALRLTISAEMDFPPDYGPPCEIALPGSLAE